MNLAESIYINSRLRTKRLRQSVVPKLIALGGRTEGLDVLDIGCGPGECVVAELEDFGAARVTAIDFDAKMVQRARHRLADYGDRATVAGAMSLIFPTRRVDSTPSSTLPCCTTCLTGKPDFKKWQECSRSGADSSPRIMT